MRIGVTMFSTDYAIPPHELALEAEARGFESVWFPEHSHIPTSRKSPWPGGPDLPKWYHDTYDPFVAMGAAAVVTKTIKLGTGVCLVVQRDPIHTAKEVATVDRLSGGRVLFGIGGGWNAEEMEDHGTAFKTRFKLMRERIEAMKEIWAHVEAEICRRAGEVRRDDAVAQAGAEAASADHRRRRLPAGRAPRRRLRRWLDADRRPRRRYAGDAAAVPRDAEGRRSRRVRRAGHAVRRRHVGRRAESAPATPASIASCSACRPRPRTRSCPCSTRAPRSCARCDGASQIVLRGGGYGQGNFGAP